MDHEPDQNITALTRVAEAISSALTKLLHDFGRHLDRDMADFIGRYLYALELDFELAATRGAGDDLQLIVEDMRELCVSTAFRLRWLGLPASPPGAIDS